MYINVLVYYAKKISKKIFLQIAAKDLVLIKNNSKFLG